MMTSPDQPNQQTGNEIAVIGMKGRFPGADNLAAFWENLKNGVESISFYSEQELQKSGISPVLSDNPNYIKSPGALLEGRESFDASFFGFTPDEAITMNPQSRIFLECAWEALENAGYNSESYNGLMGLYAGASSSFEWEVLTYLSGKMHVVGEFSAMQLRNKDFLSTRVAHQLNLRGPAIMVQTACSTSLVAIHMACQAILDGECDIALAGGVAIVPPGYGYIYQEGMIISSDGHCRAFDARSRGTVGGSGIGIVVLKALEEAIEDKDYIYAVVKGTAINNDGMYKAGYSAPSREGQTKVIRSALRVAEVDPETITYVETHGTGTVLGDPIEIEALNQAFKTNKKHYCAIGSVKTNIGHLDAAAGVASFIKTVLALKHRLIPPNLHFEKPNPKIDFENSPFYVNTRLTEWENSKHPLRAGVSSFGIGGTNAHVVLEEWRVAQNAEREAQSAGTYPYQLILLSAHTRSALEKMSQNLAKFLENNPETNLQDAAYTLQLGRKAFKYRRAAVCSTSKETTEILTSTTSTKLHTYSIKNPKTLVIFMFSGQGSQYVNMGLELYRQEPVFRQELDTCFEILETKCGYNIKDILYPAEGKEEEAREQINDVFYSGPVKFSFEYAMAKLLISWGIKPHALIGHSFGEYAAAQISGVFSLEEALTLVVLRGQLMEKTPAGAMLGVPLPEGEIKPLLGENLALAAVNAPSLCIVSGPITDVEQLEKTLNEKGHDCIRINFPRASHSNLMSSILEEFARGVGRVKLNKPKIPYISGTTGDWISIDQATDPQYWANHMAKTIRFADGITKLLEKPGCVFLQVSSDRGLPLFVSQHPGIKSENLIINTVRHPKDKLDDIYYLLDQLGLLWLYGVKIDWQSFNNEKKQRIPLPTYPFKRQPYWIEGNIFQLGAKMLSRGGPVKRANIADWFYVPSWTRSPLPLNRSTDNHEQKENTSTWLIFIDQYGLGTCLAHQLSREGHRVITVKTGSQYKQEKENLYCINYKNKDHYETLIKDLHQKNMIPGSIAHLWSVHGDEKEPSNLDFIDEQQDRGLCSLVYLARAIGNQALKTPLFIGVISEALQEVNGLEKLSPASATIMGAIKILPLEYPNINCRSVDIILPPPDTPQQEQLASQLAQELQSRHAETIVAYRGSHRWIQTFKPFPLEKTATKNPVIKKSGVYLITGGLGGIGLELAEFIGKNATNPKLILTGRSSLPPKEKWQQWLENHDNENPTSTKIQRIQQLEKLGAEVLTTSADITLQPQMEKLITTIRKQFGHINGVIHAAGLPGGGAIQLQDKNTISAILDPKVKGTVILNHVLKDIKLDFFILCSSVGSIMSAFGQSGYSAANAFLDAFAEYNTTTNGIFTTAVNWGRWKNTGMAVPIEAKHKELTGREFSGGMTAPEALEAFNRLLGIPVPRIIAIESDFLKDVLQFNKNQLEKTPHPQDTQDDVLAREDTPREKSFPRPELSTEYAAPQNEIQEKLARVWAAFFGYDRVGIQDDFFELGGDSLKALSLLQRIHRHLETKISLPEFFANPTIEKITSSIKNLEQSKYLAVQPSETKEYYALSSGQRRLYILQQMEPETTAYHVTQFNHIPGKPEKEKLQQTLKKLIQRHESLRTSFRMIGSEPIQQVHPQVEFEIVYYGSGRQGDRETGNILESSGRQGNREIGNKHSPKTPVSLSPSFPEHFKNFFRPFDLSCAPLLRVGLLPAPSPMLPASSILIVDMHHIITDGISHRILMEEFSSLYQGKELSPLKLQYKDYSEWQQSREIKNLFKEQEAYWLKELAGELPVLDLPIDYPRPPVQSYEGRTIPIEIETRITENLKKIAREHGTTLFMVVLTLFNILLAKISGQEDIIVGIDVSGRSHADLEHIIGMFVNNLPLRNFPTPAKTFKNLLEEVKTTTLKAMENQDYQFEDLVEQLAVNRDVSRNPLFDVMFSLLELDPGTGKKDKKTRQPEKNSQPKQEAYDYENQTAKFDLSLNGIEKAGHLSFSFEYCTKLFKEETIRRFITYLQQLVSAVIEDTDTKIAEIEILPPEERKQVLFDFNNTRAEFCKDKTVCEIIAGHAAQTPHRTAVVFKDTILSYKELNENSSRLARQLREKGMTHDHLAGILCERSLAMIIGILAVWKAGGAYIPIDVDYPTDRINTILADSGAKVLLAVSESQVKAEVKEKIAQPGGLQLKMINLETLSSSSTSLSSTLTLTSTYQVSPAKLAYTIYTSGSTGKPKGAMVEHMGMMNHLQAKVADLQLSGASIIVQNASHTFDISVWQFFAALLVGGKTLIYPDEWVMNPEFFINRVISHHVTILEVVPSYLTVMLEYIGPRPLFLPLQYLLVTGEEVKPHLVRKWFEIFPYIKMVNAYGPTEASDDITHHIMDRVPQGDRIPIGKTLQNLAIYIVDQHLKLCPIGIKGEIYVAGIGVGRGYLNNPELTAERFLSFFYKSYMSYKTYISKKTYKTGDLGRWLPDGTIEFFGRKDYQVKIRGFRIELGEIETKLARHPQIKESVVIVLDAPAKEGSGPGAANKYICAYFVSQQEISAGDLKEYLLKELPDYMVPAYFVSLDRLPLTPNGKINRKALPAPGIETVDSGEYIPPQNKTEERLAGIWEELLGTAKENISMAANFFTVGGHSLKATLLAARVHKEFTVKLPMAEIFRTPTIRELARYIRNASQEKFLAILPTEKKEYYPLSPAQKRLYFIHLMAPGNTAYNQPMTLELQGDVDRNRLEKTFKQLITRHESLRTSYVMLGQESMQRIHETVDFEIQYYETNPGPGKNAIEIIDKIVKPFALAQAPLIRAALVKIKEKKHVIVVDMHHIVTDGVSDNILMRDFMYLYRGRQLSPLKLQYRDFAQWQNRQLESGAVKKQEEYWLNRFKNQPPFLELPLDYPRPTTPTPHEGGLVNFTIEQKLTENLQETVTTTKTTMFMFLLAVYNILLAKYSGQEDIVVGSPVSGRRHDDLLNIMGLFINMLSLRNQPTPEKTFKEFLEEVKENALDAYENQDYQFDELVTRLGLRGTANQNPLFQVIFAAVDTDTSGEASKTDIKRYEYEKFISKFDLRLAMTQQDKEILLSLQYSKTLFKESTIRKMSTRYLEILQQVLENKDIPLKDIAISHDLIVTRSNALQDYQESFDF